MICFQVLLKTFFQQKAWWILGKKIQLPTSQHNMPCVFPFKTIVKASSALKLRALHVLSLKEWSQWWVGERAAPRHRDQGLPLPKPRGSVRVTAAVPVTSSTPHRASGHWPYPVKACKKQCGEHWLCENWTHLSRTFHCITTESLVEV